MCCVAFTKLRNIGRHFSEVQTYLANEPTSGFFALRALRSQPKLIQGSTSGSDWAFLPLLCCFSPYRPLCFFRPLAFQNRPQEAIPPTLRTTGLQIQLRKMFFFISSVHALSGKRRKEAFCQQNHVRMMNGGNFTVCTNICVIAWKIARTCSDKRLICFVNDSAVLNDTKTGCNI